LSVLTPRIVREGYYFSSLGQEASEMALIFVFGLIGLILYNWNDVRLKRLSKERQECIRSISDTSKDLTFSYNYIGTLNRKLEILKEMILTIFRELSSEHKKSRGLYLSLIQAITLFADCQDVLVGFYRKRSGKVMYEVASHLENFQDVERAFCTTKDKHSSVLYQEGYVIVRTSHSMKDVLSYCIIKRNRIKDQDIELIKALLMQGIFLFVSLDDNKEQEKRIRIKK
jgi:hypothetical protein